MQVSTIATVQLSGVLQDALSDNPRQALTTILEILESHTYLMKIQLTESQREDLQKLVKNVTEKQK